MFLKKLILKNIRSYKNLDINFKEGSTLLSGDIGSGKTTILLAIEFALFGFIKGTISGSTLLRHGEKEGSVELSFQLEKKEITIKRTLKKGSTGINQTVGHLILNNEKTDLTAVELKSKILELLGYPEDLLTKSKSLIFRYTVYTPQEEMKTILTEKSDDRLEKLRKLFDIDKYKRIKENASNYAKYLRGRIKVEGILIEDLEEIIEEKERINEEIENKSQLKEKLDSNIKTTVEELTKQKKEYELLEEKAKILIQLRNDSKLEKLRIDNANDNVAKTINDIKDMKEEIKKITSQKVEEAISIRKRVDVEDDLNKFEDGKSKVEKIISENENKLAVLESKLKDFNLAIKKVKTEDICPRCSQKITEEHKQKVISEEEVKIKESEEKQIKFQENNKLLSKKLDGIANKIGHLRNELRIAEKAELTKKIEDQNKQRVENLKKRVEELEKQKLLDEKKILEYQKKANETQKKINEMQIEPDKLRALKEKVDSLSEDIRKKELENAAINEFIKNKRFEIEKLEKEILSKKDKKKELQKTKITENWLSKQFISIVDVIEKHVLASIHQEFSQRFREWFNILLEDETIQTSLDETFAPIIHQNGYESEIDNLSGGEKTAVALAYRLALNKVINDFIGNIKTRDIIILDEPTDGFSTDQLDKVRDVLEELNSKQTIIVSHEPKMESFVENIIRIRKQEHISEIIS